MIQCQGPKVKGQGLEVKMRNETGPTRLLPRTSLRNETYEFMRIPLDVSGRNRLFQQQLLPFYEKDTLIADVIHVSQWLLRDNEGEDRNYTSAGALAFKLHIRESYCDRLSRD